MSFHLNGFVTVSYEEPVFNEDGQEIGVKTLDHTFDASDFGLEEGGGTRVEGREAVNAVYVAFGTSNQGINFEAQLSIYAICGGNNDSYNMIGRNCTITDDQIEYGFDYSHGDDDGCNDD